MVIPLHLGDNINDLQTRAKFGDVSKTKVKVLCESGAKLFKEAIVKRDLGDEESAYVLFFKYVDLIQKIRAHAEYKKDEKYFTSMYNIKKNLNKALEALETLSESLERRYSDKLKKETLKEIGDELSSKKAAKSAKSKVDFNSNENLTSTPISAVVSNGVAVQAEAKDYIITHKKLHSIISQKSTSFFILDTRSAEDYSNSHIKIPQSLNVSEQFLKPGTTAATIGKSLKIQERCQWERRTQQDMLIIADWTSEDFLPGTPVTVLRDALTKWDVGAVHKNPPYLLEGGYQKFLFAYPHDVTNPKARAPAENKILSKVAPRVGDVEYPDLDSGFLVTPSPSPKSLAAVSSGALKISKEPAKVAPPPSVSHSTGTQPKYPSLSADLNSLTPKSVSRTTTPSATDLNAKFTPSIPDRSTKPPTNPDQTGDEFNDARRSDAFSINRTESGSSINSNFSNISEAGNSQLNNALLESFKGLSITTGNGLPKIDRESKKHAVMKYFGVDETKLENVESVQEVELNVADESLEREKERLLLENKWEYLRARKEAEHEAVMRQEILEEQEKLVKELDRLAVENKEKEESEKQLLEELEKMKSLLKERDEKVKTYQKNEEERKRKEKELSEKRRKQKELLESVETKRRERKRKERDQRSSDVPRTPVSQMNGHHNHESSPTPRGAAGVKTYLRDTKESEDGGGGGLKRSFSSPNIAKMLEQEDGRLGGQSGQYGVVPVPKFDRFV